MIKELLVIASIAGMMSFSQEALPVEVAKLEVVKSDVERTVKKIKEKVKASKEKRKSTKKPVSKDDR